MSAQKRMPRRRAKGHFVLVKNSGAWPYWDWTDAPDPPRRVRRKKKRSKKP